jgi:anti-sigma regulatory factor (Ser/Thr protein kinase)
VSRSVREPAFRHEALFYSGQEGFLEGTVPFIEAAVAAEEPVLVVVSAAKIALLREALGGAAEHARFADMADVGHNPARIIPTWHEFVSAHSAGGRPFRGIGEPIWAGRSPAELVECQVHESLLNLMFADSPEWWLLCPYDTDTLDVAILDEARHSHPYVLERGLGQPSLIYRGHDIGVPSRALPEPAGPTEELAFGAGALHAIRRFVADHAVRLGLSSGQAADLVLAVNELATNSLCHAGGGGILRLWSDGATVVCEVRDGGRIDQPLIGRMAPPIDSDGGRGVWLANQLCDLVQVRSSEAGTVVRVHLSPG